MPTAAPPPLPPVVRLLGRAGLLPFIGAPLLILVAPGHTQLWAEAIALYAFAIVCFLVGSWWGLALIRRHTDAIVTSNVLVLVATLAMVALPVTLFLPLSALLLILTVAFERVHPLFSRQPQYYLRLRVQLTLVAAPALVATALLANQDPTALLR